MQPEPPKSHPSWWAIRAEVVGRRSEGEFSASLTARSIAGLSLVFWLTYLDTIGAASLILTGAVALSMLSLFWDKIALVPRYRFRAYFLLVASLVVAFCLQIASPRQYGGPYFVLDMDQIILGNVLRDEDIVARVVVIATISNTGTSAGTCGEWELRIEGPNINGYRQPWQAPFVNVPVNSPDSIQILGSSQLQNIAMDGVAQNHTERGYIEFRFTGPIIRELRGAVTVYDPDTGRDRVYYNNLFTLSCKATSGDTFSTSRCLGERDFAPLQMWAGLDFAEGTVNERQELTLRDRGWAQPGLYPEC